MDLSLKSPKKSDLNKAWMKKKSDRGIKIHPEYHLIVSEGTDTEPAYIGSYCIFASCSQIFIEQSIGQN